MTLFSPRPGRTTRLALLLAGLCAVGFLLTLPALALPSLSTFIGGQLYYAGGDVTVDVLYKDTTFGNVLQLWSGNRAFDIVDGRQVGNHVTLTQAQLADMGIGLGDELQFGIQVLNTKQNFVLGPGSRNKDGLDHAYVRFGRFNTFVGFEDLYGGGDRDYNDQIFRFSGVVRIPPRFAITREIEPSVSEPAPAILLLTGIGLLALAYRKK